MSTSPIGPSHASVSPRHAGIATFARPPRIEAVPKADMARTSVPFDCGVRYRPGARFGPAHVRRVSRLRRPHNCVQDGEPFYAQQIVDAGDTSADPFTIDEAVQQIEIAASALGVDGIRHFDAHLDTWYTNDIERTLARLGDRLVHISVDIDVLDPAHAPGTDTPEAGGLTSPELPGLVRALPAVAIIGANIVSAPAHDHAQVTAVAASHVAHKIFSAMTPRAVRASAT